MHAHEHDSPIIIYACKFSVHEPSQSYRYHVDT